MSFRRSWVSFAAVLSLVSAVAAAPPTALEDLVPEKTIVLVHAPNAERSLERLQALPQWAIVEGMMNAGQPQGGGMSLDQVEEMIRMQLGLAEGAPLPSPRGGMVVAVFTLVDAETQMPAPHLFIAGDFGDTAASLDTALAQAHQMMGPDAPVQEIRGRKAMVLPMNGGGMEMDMGAEGEEGDAEPGAAAGGEEGEMPLDMDEMAFEMGMGPGPMDWKEMFIVREGSMMLASTSADALGAALGTCDGAGSSGFGARTDFTDMRSRLGASDLSVYFLMRDLGELASAVDPIGITMMIGPVLQQFVGDVSGIGMSADLSRSSEGIAEQRVFVAMPSGKVGFPALLTEEKPVGQIPAWVPENAQQYFAANMDVPGLGRLVTEIMAMLPLPMMMGAAEDPAADQQMQEMMEMPGKFLGTFGKEMHFYIAPSTGAQAADGMGMNAVAMVACAKPAELEAMLSGPLVEMGLVPSDVNGKKFYSAPVNFGEMLPMPVPGAEMLDVAPTLTIAGNWLVAGNRGAVEQAVKTQAGGAKAKTLSIPAAAMSQLGRDPAVMWGWANLGEQFAAQIEMVKSHGAELGAAAGENPQADMALAALSMMDLNQIRRQMGHAVWRVDSEKDGFMMKSIVIGSR